MDVEFGVLVTLDIELGGGGVIAEAMDDDVGEVGVFFRCFFLSASSVTVGDDFLGRSVGISPRPRESEPSNDNDVVAVVSGCLF